MAVAVRLAVKATTGHNFGRVKQKRKCEYVLLLWIPTFSDTIVYPPTALRYSSGEVRAAIVWCLRHTRPRIRGLGTAENPKPRRPKSREV